MTGDDQPLPWIAVFQRTFSDSDQWSGAFDTAWPSAVGPRKAGQFSDGVAASEADARTVAGSRGRVGMAVPRSSGDNAFTISGPPPRGSPPVGTPVASAVR